MTRILSVAFITLLCAACGKDSEPAGSKTEPTEPPAAPATEAAGPEAPAAPSAQQPPRPPAAAGPATAVVARNLESLGYRIETPEGWILRQINEYAYAFRIPPSKVGGVAIMSQLAISKRPAPPATLADMVRECAGTVVDKSAGGQPLYYVCEQTAAGQSIRNVEYVVALPAGGSLYCSGSGADIEPMLAACKSLAPAE